mmetsp:Transcript_2134/g.9687  ORF Transcript_2134/g.9687 Transcript_2134/m.9687 type:complete len:386 (+) Transcript_2134:171-1328(+)
MSQLPVLQSGLTERERGVVARKVRRAVNLDGDATRELGHTHGVRDEKIDPVSPADCLLLVLLAHVGQDGRDVTLVPRDHRRSALRHPRALGGGGERVGNRPQAQSLGAARGLNRDDRLVDLVEVLAPPGPVLDAVTLEGGVHHRSLRRGSLAANANLTPERGKRAGAQRIASNDGEGPRRSDKGLRGEGRSLLGGVGVGLLLADLFLGAAGEPLVEAVEEAVRAVAEMSKGVHERGDIERLGSLQASHRRANANLLKQFLGGVTARRQRPRQVRDAALRHVVSHLRGASGEDLHLRRVGPLRRDDADSPHGAYDGIWREGIGAASRRSHAHSKEVSDAGVAAKSGEFFAIDAGTLRLIRDDPQHTGRDVRVHAAKARIFENLKRL